MSLLEEKEAFEALMYASFEEEPFHNLVLIFPNDQYNLSVGGTCSDKSLSFLKTAREHGFDVSLHVAKVNGELIHRLIRVVFQEKVFFADVGNGWPSIQLYPQNQAVEYSCFGIRFRTEIQVNHLKVFHTLRGKETLQMEIGFIPFEESLILKQIENRFTSGIQYPFQNNLRVSAIVGDNFVFIRDSKVFIYQDDEQQIFTIDKSFPLHYWLNKYFKVLC